jgi:hypothetical protein
MFNFFIVHSCFVSNTPIFEIDPIWHKKYTAGLKSQVLYFATKAFLSFFELWYRNNSEHIAFSSFLAFIRGRWCTYAMHFSIFNILQILNLELKFYIVFKSWTEIFYFSTVANI